MPCPFVLPAAPHLGTFSVILCIPDFLGRPAQTRNTLVFKRDALGKSVRGSALWVGTYQLLAVSSQGYLENTLEIKMLSKLLCCLPSESVHFHSQGHLDQDPYLAPCLGLQLGLVLLWPQPALCHFPSGSLWVCVDSGRQVGLSRRRLAFVSSRELVGCVIEGVRG